MYNQYQPIEVNFIAFYPHLLARILKDNPDEQAGYLQSLPSFYSQFPSKKEYVKDRFLKWLYVPESTNLFDQFFSRYPKIYKEIHKPDFANRLESTQDNFNNLLFETYKRINLYQTPRGYGFNQCRFLPADIINDVKSYCRNHLGYIIPQDISYNSITSTTVNFSVDKTW